MCISVVTHNPAFCSTRSLLLCSFNIKAVGWLYFEVACRSKLQVGCAASLPNEISMCTRFSKHRIQFLIAGQSEKFERVP
jgi:hypothetical protein